MIDNPILLKALERTGARQDEPHDVPTTSIDPKEIINVFPDFIKDFILDQVKAYKKPVEFYLAGVLSASSIAIGNSLNLKFAEGWKVPASLFISIVGNSGLGKSPALKACLKPIFELENTMFKTYKGELADYLALDKEDQKTEDVPVRRELYLNDTTIEAVLRVLSDNPHGLLIYRDELLGWVKSMNAYKSGSDVETWLSIWSCASTKVTRQNGNEYTIPRPFASVVGGIQPAKLLDIVKGGNLDNGFFYRFLFVYPDDQKMKVPTNNGSNPDIAKKYEETIKALFVRSKALEFEKSNSFLLSDDARRKYNDFYGELCDKVNNANDDSYQSMIVKLLEYTLRFALNLHTLDLVTLPEFEFTNSYKYTITGKTMDRAIILARFFIKQSEKALIRALNLAPLQELNSKDREFYDSLPDLFTTSMAKDLANASEMPERTLFRLLKDRVLFDKVKHGQYGKCF